MPLPENNKPAARALILLCVLLSGCKGGDPISGGISSATASFVADAPDPGVTERFIAFRVGSEDAGRIVLDVVVTEVDEPVTALVLNLIYPVSFSRFVRCSDGDLFPPGQFFCEESAQGSGEVFVVRSVSTAQATTVGGSRVALRMEFLAFGEGEGRIDVEGQNLGGSDSSALLDVDGDPIFMQWYSGELRGERPD